MQSEGETAVSDMYLTAKTDTESDVYSHRHHAKRCILKVNKNKQNETHSRKPKTMTEMVAEKKMK